ncbi:ATP-dependent helicase HrpB [Leucobacter exalbidus]|uniref:ATP-dependent helicase HrpB n=1 Tax=Leucobacter exalbidus TaxID=662960 RepID=A0A940Q0L4_9MICO|nr:ATP-dependent helicase HrpB [Leucobacter exalbidus]
MTPLLFDLYRIGSGLIVSQAQNELSRAAASGAFVVTAPPGTGKTTFVPPLVANLLAERAAHGASPENDLQAAGSPSRVILTQPRRVAARAAATRLAQLSGSALGEEVGVTIRGERHVSARTRIEVVTPGVLLRRLIADPELPGVGAVILDEVHERTVEGDLLLGMVAEARALRDDLIVAAMSATLEAARISELLGDAPVVEIPSVLHSLTIEHAPYAEPRLDARGTSRGFLAHLAQVALRSQRAAGCDALVFVPGAREVDDVVALLRSGAASQAPNELEILPLHGRIPAREQDRAVRGRGADEPPRIIVSTSLAESSLTVPGVRLVIDSGLAREVRRDRGRDMSGLSTVSASRASAEQRAGRAARQGPGHAVRVYSEAEYAHMRAHAQPDIASADLTDAALLLAAWGTPGAEGLALPTAPPAAAMSAAVATLRALELVDDRGHITPAGRSVALLPVGARSARALVEGAQVLGDACLAAETVAAISDDFREPSADLPRLLRELRTGRHPGAARWKRESERLLRIAAQATGTLPRAAGPAITIAATATAPGTVIALGRPEWVARRTGEHSRSYLLASGTRAALPEGSELASYEWLAVHEVQRAEGRAADGTGAVIRMAAPFDETEALKVARSLVTFERTASIAGGKLRVREERRLGAIVLTQAPVRAEPSDIAPAYTAHLRSAGLGALTWREGASSLRTRLALIHRELGAPWPDVSDEALLANLDDWLGPDLGRLRADSSLAGLELTQALRRRLPWPEAAKLDELAPEQLAVPSGSRVRIDYSGDAQPVVAVKLQELFGLAETPRLVNGRVPVLFHLLSPARKPLAVTADLRSFWDGPYQQVRSEMRGRYPKHPWPEDPWTAQATARTKRAQQ